MVLLVILALLSHSREHVTAGELHQLHRYLCAHGATMSPHVAPRAFYLPPSYDERCLMMARAIDEHATRLYAERGIDLA